jgi:hypothetical protein
MSDRDARTILEQLVGRTIPTLSGQPNVVLAVNGVHVLVGTRRSPGGRRVSLGSIQAAVERLFDHGEVAINVNSVGFRSAFIGAVLSTIPGTTATSRPGTVKLLERDQ